MNIHVGAKAANNLNCTNKNNVSNDKSKTQNTQLDNLKKQREDLVKKKNALMAKTAEKGQSLETIQDQLKIYDQQIQNLTTQISKETTAAAKGTIQDNETNKNKSLESTSQPKTEEEVNNEKLSSIANLGASFETIKTINSIKTKTENEVTITQGEINADTANRDSFIEHVSWTNPEAASLLSKQGASDNKYDKLAGLNQRIVELSKSLGNTMNGVQQEIEDSRLQEKIQALIKDWNKANKADGDKSSQDTSSADASSTSSDTLQKFDKALEKAPKLTADFLSNFAQWNQEANEKMLTDAKKEDFLYDKLEEWEDNLQKKSPEQYGSWKLLTSSIDVYA